MWRALAITSAAGARVHKLSKVFMACIAAAAGPPPAAEGQALGRHAVHQLVLLLLVAPCMATSH